MLKNSYLRALPSLALVGCLYPEAAAARAPVDYTTARLDRRLPAVRATGPMTLDGRLEEPGWVAAPLAKDFIQNDPQEGEPATFDTEVRLLYDDDALYIGVFARDNQPSGIIVSELRKDFNTGSGDGFQVVIDTFRDERNGYQFAVNPMGAKWTPRCPTKDAKRIATGMVFGTSRPGSPKTAGSRRSEFRFAP